MVFNFLYFNNLRDGHYPLQRFFNPASSVVTSTGRLLTLSLATRHAALLRSPFNGYQFHLIILFFDAAGKALDTQTAGSGWVNADANALHAEYTFNPQANSCYWLVALHLLAGVSGDASSLLAAQGMAIFGCSELSIVL